MQGAGSARRPGTVTARYALCRPSACQRPRCRGLRGNDASHRVQQIIEGAEVGAVAAVEGVGGGVGGPEHIVAAVAGKPVGAGVAPEGVVAVAAVEAVVAGGAP